MSPRTALGGLLGQALPLYTLYYLKLTQYRTFRNAIKRKREHEKIVPRLSQQWEDVALMSLGSTRLFRQSAMQHIVTDFGKRCWSVALCILWSYPHELV